MRRLFGLGWGLLLVLFGTGLLAWIGYNFLIEMQPEAEGRSPVAPLIFAVSILLIGISRIRKGLRA